MTLLGSEMNSPVREVLGLEEKVGSSKLSVFVWWSGKVVGSVVEAGNVVESVPSRCCGRPGKVIQDLRQLREGLIHI